ncbi:hypothetical protein GEU84_001120 [Fertoebacter nigrum]|uniref:Rcc01698-like C-terminal domain-containing protein n=1 Tax=Fertoeibacter niger TaxID=2656921 RepID=A0A8X8GTT7_9RHOB|nr:hypothetical protein [Fertoeibacter niger]NUB42972.1 hypothetical protein [Fertoeibacter niger]
MEAAVYTPSDAVDERVVPRAFVAPVPVFPVFLDLPLLTGAEVPHAPHIAVAGTPWPGSVALWSAAEDAGYDVNRLLAAPAVIGVTETALFAAPLGLWDRGTALRVRVYGGSLSAASELAVLNGANVMAIGDGSSDRWEVFQFAQAVLVEPGTYDISLRLRGQAGSDAVMPEVWPAGSLVVLLNKAVQQVELAASARGLARHYRIGAAARGFADPAVVHRVEAFQGIGLRPYAPVHLRAVAEGGDLHLSWVRRGRLDGDTWESQEVPLGEEREAYLLRVTAGGMVLREVEVAGPAWTYTAAMRGADGISGAYQIGVAQVSDRFGPGPFRLLDLMA